MVAENTVVGKRYRILTEIGRGGMSTVYLALDSSLNKQWAVKEIRNVEDPVRRGMIIKSLTVEANMIKRFDHPAIPRIVDLIDENGSLYVVMDYIEGRTLSAILRSDGPQPEDRVVDWGVQLCDALDYLHRRNPAVIYRDMKPSNVMVTPDGAIKLIDFGIAIEVGGDAHDQLIGDDRQLGTPGYGAPEQFDSAGVVDARTDIYGLGATLYTLLTGTHPPEDGFEPIRDINPDLSPGLERIIMQATQHDPADRFQDCAQMAYALRHYREADDDSRHALVNRWRGFLAVVIASLLCFVLSAGSLGMAFRTRNGDYQYWIDQASQATDPGKVEEENLRAASVKSDSIQPYLNLIRLYTADGNFTAEEERVYNSAITEHSESLRTHPDDWASLCFETGKLYWYYYLGSESGASTRQAQESSRTARIRAASQWMHNAAQDKNFKHAHLAGIYAGMADFNTQIVPLINEGSDAGKYRPYAVRLQELVSASANEKNDVIRLDVANLTLDALQVYPRKFRADGVTKQELNTLADDATHLAKTVTPTTTVLDSKKQEATELAKTVHTEIDNAYVDIKGDKQ